MMLNTAELIYQEAKTLPDSLGAQVLDFIGYLRTRYPIPPALEDKATKIADLEEFFSHYQRSLRNFQFNRDEANER